jgi:hypothetical protein
LKVSAILRAIIFRFPEQLIGYIWGQAPYSLGTRLDGLEVRLQRRDILIVLAVSTAGVVCSLAAIVSVPINTGSDMSSFLRFLASHKIKYK